MKCNSKLSSSAFEIAKFIKKAPKIGLFFHINPDGDTFSCSYGLLKALKIKYPQKEIYVVGDYKTLQALFPFLKLDKKHFKEKIDPSYLAIVGDTSVIHRVSSFEEYQKAQTKICFDHHKNQIEFEVNHFWNEPNWGASAMQTWQIVKALKIKLDEKSSLLLSIGLLTDTGNFFHSLADYRPPYYYSEYLKNISNQKIDFFFKNLRQKNKESLLAQGDFYQTIKFQGKVIYGSWDHKLTKKYPNINSKMMLGPISNIKDYPIWILFSYQELENKEKVWQISFRSNGLDLIPIAQKFNGGGHTRASGGQVSYKTKIDKVIKDVNQLISKKVSILK